MPRISGFYGPDHDQEHAWPELLCPADPWCGDEAVAEHGTYEAHCAFTAQPLSPEEWLRRDQEFEQIYRAILDGRLRWGSESEVAAALRIAQPRRHDTRPHGPPATQEVTHSVLTDIVEDWTADAPAFGADSVLGPWGEARLVPRRVRALAAAVLCLSPIISQRVRPITRYLRDEPPPPPRLRESLLAVLHAPACLWAHEGGGHLRPLIPFSPRLLPTGPVHGLPEAPAFVGRVLEGPRGWWMALALPLPAAPDSAILTRRMDLEMLRLRRHERRLTWEDLLRDRAEVLYRSSCEWVFACAQHLLDSSGVPPCWWSV